MSRYVKHAIIFSDNSLRINVSEGFSRRCLKQIVQKQKIQATRARQTNKIYMKSMKPALRLLYVALAANMHLTR